MLHLLPLLSAASLAAAPVVGGTTVEPGTWRDAVAVLSPDAVCTGTLIAPDVVLTAGHCIDPAPIFVVVDTVDYGQPGGEPIRVKAAAAYPAWQDSYDVGVIVLEHAASAPPRVVAATCTARAALVAGAAVHLVGFGLTTTTGKGENSRLHEGVVPVLDPTCADPDACMPSVSPGGEFIAGGSGVDSCFGDSGGPVYVDTPDGPALAGVVSRGYARTGPPCGAGGVYVRADRVISWVERITGAPIRRTRCAGAADEPVAATTTDDAGGGCAATRAGSPSFGLAAVLSAGLIRRRRRAPS
jgi:endonuclease G